MEKFHDAALDVFDIIRLTQIPCTEDPYSVSGSFACIRDRVLMVATFGSAPFHPE